MSTRANAWSGAPVDAPLGGDQGTVFKTFASDPTAVAGLVGGIAPADGDKKARQTLYGAVGAIGLALVLLWVFGGLVFKDANI